MMSVKMCCGLGKFEKHQFMGQSRIGVDLGTNILEKFLLYIYQ